jgi:hypothetical protein
LSGSPVLTRQDAVIDFNWGYGSPDSRILSDGFSVRWDRIVHFEAGRYRFTATSDDGVRLWVNDHLLIDHWRDQALTAHSGSLYLDGDVPISMEYYENGGVAGAHLTWSLDDGELPPPDDVILVDDTDLGFVTGRSSYSWRMANEGYSGHLTWTWNNDWRRPNYNWARCIPALPQVATRSLSTFQSATPPRPMRGTGSSIAMATRCASWTSRPIVTAGSPWGPIGSAGRATTGSRWPMSRTSRTCRA